MAHLMINSDDQCENKAKMNAKAHSRQQMKFRWSVWTLDGRCGHPSANQNVASSKGGQKRVLDFRVLYFLPLPFFTHKEAPYLTTVALFFFS